MGRGRGQGKIAANIISSLRGPQSEYQEKFDQGIEYLNNNFAFFLTHVLNIGKPRWTDSEIPTAAVGFEWDGKDITAEDLNYEFIFNSDFAKQLSAEDMGFICAHETMHVLLDHPKMMTQFENKALFNIAADVVINDFLSDHGIEGMEGIMRGEQILGYNCSNLTVTEVYNTLEEKIQEALEEHQKEQSDQDENESEEKEDKGESEGDKGQEGEQDTQEQNGDSENETTNQEGEQDTQEQNRDSENETTNQEGEQDTEGTEGGNGQNGGQNQQETSLDKSEEPSNHQESQRNGNQENDQSQKGNGKSENQQNQDKNGQGESESEQDKKENSERENGDEEKNSNSQPGNETEEKEEKGTDKENTKPNNEQEPDQEGDDKNDSKEENKQDGEEKDSGEEDSQTQDEDNNEGENKDSGDKPKEINPETIQSADDLIEQIKENFNQIDDHQWMETSEKGPSDKQEASSEKSEQLYDEAVDNGMEDIKAKESKAENQQSAGISGVQAGHGHFANRNGFQEVPGIEMNWNKLLEEVDPDIFKQRSRRHPTRASFHRRPRQLSGFENTILPVQKRDERRDGKDEEKPVIVMALDTSGSVQKKDVDRFLTLAKSIPEDRIDLRTCTFTTVPKSLDLENPRFNSGGTNFSAIEDFIQKSVINVDPNKKGETGRKRKKTIKKYPKSVIVITDGQARFRGKTPTKEQLDNNWTWLITDNGRNPFGYSSGKKKTVHRLKDFITLTK